ERRQHGGGGRNGRPGRLRRRSRLQGESVGRFHHAQQGLQGDVAALGAAPDRVGQIVNVALYREKRIVEREGPGAAPRVGQRELLGISVPVRDGGKQVAQEFRRDIGDVLEAGVLICTSAVGDRRG